ncbi:sorting nexin-18-like isoform X2 [Panulirus ornatus]|uniref:sorting nexin-18-like isoform X2 n=1 Tax=Panulirus ornatus TaxID=150431 RepID=UPI003A88C92B
MEKTEKIGLVAFDIKADEITFEGCEAAGARYSESTFEESNCIKTSVDQQPVEGVAAEPNKDKPVEEGDKDIPEEVIQNPTVDVTDGISQQKEAVDTPQSPRISKSDSSDHPLRGVSSVKVRALYNFDAQPGTGELSIKEGEILSVSRQDVGEGWWEGSNAQGQAGLFPAAYVEEITSAPPAMPPPPLPTEYANVEWGDSKSNIEADNWHSVQNNTTSSIDFTGNNQKRPASQQISYDNDDWDDDWDDDDSEPGNNYLNGAGNFGLSAPNRASKSASSVGDVSTAGAGKASVDEKEKVYVDDFGNGPCWRANPHEFTCVVSSPKKESKFHGMKSFIAYSLLPSFATTPVSRRYKHFDWIQGRLSEKFPLIPIPPLPEKQLSG